MAEQAGISWPGWEIAGVLGRGGFGTVYEIRRELFGDVERAALKVIRIPQNEDEIEYLRCTGVTEADIRTSFYRQAGDIAREYKLMAQMRSHPNVVCCDDFRVVERTETPGCDVYIKMELLTPLLRVLDQVSTEQQVTALGKDLCRALEACQEKNIIHRDIKPQNVFVDDNGRFKLGDFGIARTAERTTQATAGIGTYSFMAPEILQNKAYGKTVDIYSLGMLLYWLLNHRRGPFLPLPPAMASSVESERAWQRRFSGEPLPLPVNGSPALQAVVLKACAYDPKDRYQSAAEMLQALEQTADAVQMPLYTTDVTEQEPAQAEEQTQSVWSARGDSFVQREAPAVPSAAVWKRRGIWILCILLAGIVTVSGILGFLELKRHNDSLASSRPQTQQTQPPRQETQQAQTPGESEEVEIEVWIAQLDWESTWYALERRFEDQYPHINVKHVGMGEDDTFLTACISANELPDIVRCFNDFNMDEMESHGMLTDLSGWTCTAAVPAFYQEQYRFGDQTLGLCMGASFSCMYYNMQLLNEAGWTQPPETWQELLQCCADIEAYTDAKPLVAAAGTSTGCWMPLELILANTIRDPAANTAYQEAFEDGTFQWTRYPEAADRLDALVPYLLQGCTTTDQQEALDCMAEQRAAMCLGGCWMANAMTDAIAAATGSEAAAAASLPPFGSSSTPWISVAPEEAFCVTEDTSRTDAEQEAVELFFNWLFEPENFVLIHNARGTYPVLLGMVSAQLDLPACMIPVAQELPQAPAVKMGFRMWTPEFADVACGNLRAVMDGQIDSRTLLQRITDYLPGSSKK